MATQNKVHSEFSMRLNLSFKAGFSEDSSEQLLRDLVAFLKLKRAVGTSNSWIKEAILEAFIRERAGAGAGESLAQLSGGQLPHEVTQQPNAAQPITPPRRDEGAPTDPVSSKRRIAPAEAMSTEANEDVAGALLREESLEDESYSDLLAEPGIEPEHQPEPAIVTGLPKGLMSIMG